MKSKNVDRFQHDSYTEVYDTWVQNESNPMRAGYDQTLNWVAETSNSYNPSHILEMGTGTGALTKLLKSFNTVVCVDASIEMIKKAQTKLLNLNNIQFKICDFLEFFDSNSTKFDMLVSTYALHHLEDDEKEIFFQKAIPALKTNGHILIGDIMFLDHVEKQKIIQLYKQKGLNEALGLIENQYFWNISKTQTMLAKLGFTFRKFQISQLSWGLDCFKV